MYHPWNLGGAKSFFFRDLGGLSPPSTCVEPPLLYVFFLDNGNIDCMCTCRSNNCHFRTSMLSESGHCQAEIKFFQKRLNLGLVSVCLPLTELQRPAWWLNSRVRFLPPGRSQVRITL